jgi:hypothetical protein
MNNNMLRKTLEENADKLIDRRIQMAEKMTKFLYISDRSRSANSHCLRIKRPSDDAIGNFGLNNKLPPITQSLTHILVKRFMKGK